MVMLCEKFKDNSMSVGYLLRVGWSSRRTPFLSQESRARHRIGLVPESEELDLISFVIARCFFNVT